MHRLLSINAISRYFVIGNYVYFPGRGNVFTGMRFGAASGFQVLRLGAKGPRLYTGPTALPYRSGLFLVA